MALQTLFSTKGMSVDVVYLNFMDKSTLWTQGSENDRLAKKYIVLSCSIADSSMIRMEIWTFTLSCTEFSIFIVYNDNTCFQIPIQGRAQSKCNVNMYR